MRTLFRSRFFASQTVCVDHVKALHTVVHKRFSFATINSRHALRGHTMKHTVLAAGALGLILTLPSAAAPGDFIDIDATTPYATLGYDYHEAGRLDVNGLNARVGVRFGSYIGVEGELRTGLNEGHFIYSPPCYNGVCPMTMFVALVDDVRLKNAESAYVVGYMPLSPDADLFVRAGYGFSDYSARVFTTGFSEQSFNIGAGGQYFLDEANGMRLDYLREQVTRQNLVGREGTGKGLDVWSIAFVRKF